LVRSLINTRNMRNMKLTVLSVALMVLIGLPLGVKNPYMLHLLIIWFVSAVLGMSFALLFSTGLISLGVAAFYAIGAYASVLLVMKAGVCFWLALPLSTIITGIIALGLGFIIVRHPGVSFCVISLVFNLFIVQVVGQFELFGGWNGITGIPRPESVMGIGFETKTACYYLILFLLLLVALTFWALYSSRIGRTWNTIKLGSNLAETSGINVYRYRLLAFVIASATAGLVGSFYAHYYQVIMPDTFGGFASIYIQLYAVLGGFSFCIVGPVCGALIMTFIPEFLRISGEIEPIITGTLLLIIILFIPTGIIGSLQKFLPMAWVSIFPLQKK
jgi:branched-chain amino acid transport system permease protein